MAKETRLSIMIRSAKDHISFLEERKTNVQEQIDLVDAEIAVKKSAKTELNKQVKSLERDIAEETKVLEKLEA